MNVKTFNDVSSIDKLGKSTKYDYDEPSVDILETFKNTAQGRFYTIVLDCPEFTSKCPVTNQPDFANIKIQYIPNELCVETKSLKLYLGAYRNYGCFMESTTNRILDDIRTVCDPFYIRVIGKFMTRGGIALDVDTAYCSDAYKKATA